MYPNFVFQYLPNENLKWVVRYVYFNSAIEWEQIAMDAGGWLPVLV